MIHRYFCYYISIKSVLVVCKLCMFVFNDENSGF